MKENYPPGDPGFLEQELEEYWGEVDEATDELEDEIENIDKGRNINFHYN